MFRLRLQQRPGAPLCCKHNRNRRCSARLEAVLDFGDDASLGASEAAAAASDAASLAAELEAAAAAAGRGALARAGVKLVIAGRPNGGKSSLLNALAGRPAAIVSAVAGTTRDVVEVPLALAGHRVAVAGEPAFCDCGRRETGQGQRHAAWCDIVRVPLAQAGHMVAVAGEVAGRLPRLPCTAKACSQLNM